MMLVYGLALFWLLGYALNRLPVTLAFQKARWFHLGFILVTSWLFIQQIPLPEDWVKALSPPCLGYSFSGLSGTGIAPARFTPSLS